MVLKSCEKLKLAEIHDQKQSMEQLKKDLLEQKLEEKQKQA